MADYRDNQLNDFLEMGTRDDCINFYITPENPEPSLFSKFMGESDWVKPPSKIVDMSDWEKHPVESIFDCSPAPVYGPIVRPATEPPKKRKRGEIKKDNFISYQAITEFCEKVGGM